MTVTRKTPTKLLYGKIAENLEVRSPNTIKMFSLLKQIHKPINTCYENNCVENHVNQHVNQMVPHRVPLDEKNHPYKIQNKQTDVRLKKSNIYITYHKSSHPSQKVSGSKVQKQDSRSKNVKSTFNNSEKKTNSKKHFININFDPDLITLIWKKEKSKILKKN